MTHRITLAAALLSAIWGVPAWGQNEGNAQGCDAESPLQDSAPHPRTQVTWVKTADGKRRPVISPVKQMKVAQLIFVGTPAVPLSVQEQIAKSLSEIDYDDNEDGLNELMERVKDAWLEHGYFRAKVEHSGSQTLEETPETRTVATTVNVDAGKQYRLEEIHLADAGYSNASRSDPAVPRPAEQQQQFSREQLRSFFPIQQGDILNIHKIQKGVEELRKAYGEKGFINFTVVPKFEIDEGTSSITLVMEIEEGKQFHIGNIEASGLDRGIAEELFQSSGLIRGKVYSTSLVERFLKQVQSILPNSVSPADDVERRLHEESGTVDLFFSVRACPVP